MSIFNDKALKSVAEAAAKIMEAELSAKQKAIAKIAEPKHKIDAGDLAKLRAGHKPVKEEQEQIDEISQGTVKSYLKKATSGKNHPDALEDRAEYHNFKADRAEEAGRMKTADKHIEKMHNYIRKSDNRSQGIKSAQSRLNKEDVEQTQEVLQEYQSTGGVYKHQGTYGTTKGAEYGSTEWDKENKEAKKMTKPASRKLGARQNYVRSIKESFTDMLSAYNEQGLKAFAKETIQEEPDNEQFTKELEDQKASMEGKKKQPSVAAASTQGVKNMPEEIEVIDANEINGVKIDTIEEKTLTEPEMKKKEEVVKSMKKKLPGFKERYGERAKSVMYATATKIAKEKT